MSEQIDRLKRMAVNAGASREDQFVDMPSGPGNPEVLMFDADSLGRYTRAIAEDCAKQCKTPWDDPSSAGVTAERCADVIRNLYREQS